MIVPGNSSLRVAILAAAGLVVGAASTSGPPADLVVYGRVWTGDSARPWAGGVATRGDTIVAVGDSADIATLVGAGTKVLSNGKAMVVPGMMDGHTHFIDSGLQLLDVDLRSSKTPAEFISRLKAFALEGRAPRCRRGNGSTRLRPTIPCSSIAWTATWPWPTVWRWPRLASVAAPETFPAA